MAKGLPNTKVKDGAIWIPYQLVTRANYKIFHEVVPGLDLSYPDRLAGKATGLDESKGEGRDGERIPAQHEEYREAVPRLFARSTTSTSMCARGPCTLSWGRTARQIHGHEMPDSAIYKPDSGHDHFQGRAAERDQYSLRLAKGISMIHQN